MIDDTRARGLIAAAIVAAFVAGTLTGRLAQSWREDEAVELTCKTRVFDEKLACGKARVEDIKGLSACRDARIEDLQRQKTFIETINKVLEKR